MRFLGVVVSVLKLVVREQVGVLKLPVKNARYLGANWPAGARLLSLAGGRKVFSRAKIGKNEEARTMSILCGVEASMAMSRPATS